MNGERILESIVINVITISCIVIVISACVVKVEREFFMNGLHVTKYSFAMK